MYLYLELVKGMFQIFFIIKRAFQGGNQKAGDYFKVSQDAFNRLYKLVVPENSHLRNASVMNTKKKLAGV